MFGAVELALGGRGAPALPPPPLPPSPPPPPPPSEVTQSDLMVYGGFGLSFSIGFRPRPFSCSPTSAQ
ncbi:hypothetical protein niasHT_031783 [Heterodera trifolii]|uniref:Uncharacterized protein n=1 Tax=Heterodera trifolii TaxID=157864 RepID=A0ABD2IH28_9BILA